MSPIPPSRKIHFNIILPPTSGSSKWSPSLRFPHRNPVCTSLPIRAICPTHLSLLVLVARKIQLKTIIIYSNNNLSGKYWATVGSRLSRSRGDPKGSGPNYSHAHVLVPTFPSSTSHTCGLDKLPTSMYNYGNANDCVTPASQFTSCNGVCAMQNALSHDVTSRDTHRSNVE